MTGNNVAYTTNMFVQLVNTENTISAIHRTIPLKQETFSAEIDNSEKSSDGRATLELYSHAELPTEIENVNAKNTVGSNVRGLIANLPSIFSKKLSGNEKLRIYYQIVFGIDITCLLYTSPSPRDS